MRTDFTKAQKIFIAPGKTDLRKGIRGLAAIVQQNFQLDPFTDSLFLFCGTRKDRIKALYWTGQGFMLVYLRLAEGRRFIWPKDAEAVRELSLRQLNWLLEGLSVDTDVRVEQYRAVHTAV